MANQAFVEALSDAAEDGEIDLADLRSKCIAAVLAGNGSVDFVSSASGTGKSATLECKMPPHDLLAAVNQAMRLCNGTAVGVAYADFSQMR